VTPAIFKSLDLDKDIAAMTRYANTFKSLQDRFRQARNISALGDFDEFKKEFASLNRDPPEPDRTL
jgi:trans-2-enoyl-CoA reductase